MKTKLAQLMRAMINYDSGDVPRILQAQHFYFFAKSLPLNHSLTGTS